MKNREIILEVGSEGGSITLFGTRGADGWTYLVSTFDGSDPDEEPARTRTKPLSSWAEALTGLDRYPWVHLYPLQIHPEFHELVMKAVQQRLCGLDEMATLSRWRTL